MKTVLHRFATVAIVAALFAPTVAQAQVTTFNTLAAWTAAVSNVGVDTYDNLAVTSFPGPLNRTAGAYSYTASTVAPAGPPVGLNFFPAGTAGDVWLSTDNALVTIRFGGFGSSVRGLGGFFFGSNSAGAFVPGVTLNLAATTTGGGTQNFSMVGVSTTSFFGFLAASDWTSLTVTAVQPAGSFNWSTVNDFRVAQAPVNTVVPEPSTYAMMATGLVGLIGIARRRRTR